MADQAGILAPADPMVLAIRASIAIWVGSMWPLSYWRLVPSLSIRLVLRGGIGWAGFMRRPIGPMTPCHSSPALNKSPRLIWMEQQVWMAWVLRISAPAVTKRRSRS